MPKCCVAEDAVMSMLKLAWPRPTASSCAAAAKVLSLVLRVLWWRCCSSDRPSRNVLAAALRRAQVAALHRELTGAQVSEHLRTESVRRRDAE